MEDPYEQGIPHHGLYAPLNPNAGDVQAPSPGPTQSQLPSGIGFFNDGSARAHSRRKSANFAPPGSYGLHSHFSDHQDRFERDWYAKNRERAAIEEQNQFGRPQPSNALSSAELNRIVTRDDAGKCGRFSRNGWVLTSYRFWRRRYSRRRSRFRNIRSIRGPELTKELPAKYANSQETSVERFAACG